MFSLQKCFDLIQVGFVVVLITYVFECVDYKILFNIEAPAGKQHGEKVLLSDVTVPVGKCAANFAFKVNEILKIVIDRIVIIYTPGSLPNSLQCSLF